MSNFHSDKSINAPDTWTSTEKMQAHKSFRQRLSSFVPMPPPAMHLRTRNIVQPLMNVDRIPQMNSRDTEEERRATVAQSQSVMPKRIVLREDGNGVRECGCSTSTYVMIGLGIVVAAYVVMRYMRN